MPESRHTQEKEVKHPIISIRDMQYKLLPRLFSQRQPTPIHVKRHLEYDNRPCDNPKANSSLTPVALEAAEASPEAVNQTYVDLEEDRQTAVGLPFVATSPQTPPLHQLATYSF